MTSGRLELPRPCGQQILSLLYLPIPPRGRGAGCCVTAAAVGRAAGRCRGAAWLRSVCRSAGLPVADLGRRLARRHAGVASLRPTVTLGGDHRRSPRDRPHPRLPRAAAGAGRPGVAASAQLPAGGHELSAVPPLYLPCRAPDRVPPPPGRPPSAARRPTRPCGRPAPARIHRIGAKGPAAECPILPGDVDPPAHTGYAPESWAMRCSPGRGGLARRGRSRARSVPYRRAPPRGGRSSPGSRLPDVGGYGLGGLETAAAVAGPVIQVDQRQAAVAVAHDVAAEYF